MSSKRPSDSVRESAFVGLRTSMTVEEVDCERRGYKLTKTVLGTGAYAKVKLAYVMENKIEKDRRLAEDLLEKGHNMVGKLFVVVHIYSQPLFVQTQDVASRYYLQAQNYKVLGKRSQRTNFATMDQSFILKKVV